MHDMRQAFIKRWVETYNLNPTDNNIRKSFINQMSIYIASDDRYAYPFDYTNESQSLNWFEYTMTVRYVLRVTPYLYIDYFIFDYTNEWTGTTEQTDAA